MIPANYTLARGALHTVWGDMKLWFDFGVLQKPVHR